MQKKLTNNLSYLPIVGIIIYVALFALGTLYYPGGLLADTEGQGFSFFHNVLCDLTLRTTEDGSVNEARPLAVIGHLILGGAMILFFYYLPLIFSFSNTKTKLIRWFGMMSMTVFLFMYSDFHDVIVTIVGITGSIALLPYFLVLHHYEGKRFRLFSYATFVASIIVFLSFETKIGIYYLPFIQKITFVICAIWVAWVGHIVAQKRKLQGP